MLLSTKLKQKYKNTEKAVKRRMFKQFEHEIRIAYPTNEKPDVMVTVRYRCSKYFNSLLLGY